MRCFLYYQGFSPWWDAGMVFYFPPDKKRRSESYWMIPGTFTP
jgi:hypothetical protein